MPYYVVNAGRGRSTHIMQSKSPSTPNPRSAEGIIAQLLWFGGNPKYTLCGLQATRYVDVFSPAEASCRECKRRWQLAQPDQGTKPAQSAQRSSNRSVRKPKPSISSRVKDHQPSTAARTINSPQEAGAMAIWVVDADIPVGDLDEYSSGWNRLSESQRNRYRNMALACITASDAMKG